MAEDIQVVAHLRAIDDGFTKAFQQASSSANRLNQTVGGVNKGLIAAGAVIGGSAFALVKMGKASFQAAARVSELNVAIDAIGKSTGIGAKNIKNAANAIRDNGIEMASAQQMAIEFAQGNLDMAEASNVARVAQDLAVISQKNSTDTAMLLTRAIKTGNSMLLKSAGVSGQASEGYATYAREIGKTANTLNAQERQQAVINLILEEGTKVAGVYTAAMQEPGKVLRSFPRIINDMQVAMGGALLAGFGPMIKASYDLVSAFSKTIREGGVLYPVVQQLATAMTLLFTPFTNGIKHMTELVKGLSKSKLSVDGLGASVARYTPMIASFATALSAIAGRSLLMNLGPLAKLAPLLNPVVGSMAILVALNPKLRDSFMRLAKALAPVLDGFKKAVPAITEAMQSILDAIASMVEVLAGPLALAVKVVAGAFWLFASALEVLGPFLEPLIILIGIGLAGSMMKAAVAEAIFAVGAGTATTAQTLLGKSVLFSSGMIEYFQTATRMGATGMQAFTAMTVQGFVAMKAAVISFMSSMLPMLAVAIAMYAVFKIFQAFSDRNKQVEERTKSLTGAIEEQVKALHKDKDALGVYLGSTAELGKTIATTGEDGEKLTAALNYLGKSQADAIPTLLAFKDNQQKAAYEMAIANGVSEEQALLIARNVELYEKTSQVLIGVAPEYQELAKRIEELDDQAEKTHIRDFVQGHLESVIALGKEEAALVKATQALVEAEYAASGKAGTDEMWLAVLAGVGKEVTGLTVEVKKSSVEIEKASVKTFGLIGRLREFKAAGEDGKATAEELAKAMFGIENYDAVANAKTWFEMREALTGIQDAAKGARGDFDALTKSGFDLFEQINKNSAAMYNMKKSKEEIAAASSVMIEGFMASAKAGGALDTQINAILESLNLLGGLRTKIVIDADITGVTAKLAAVVKAMELMTPAEQQDEMFARTIGLLKGQLDLLEKESKAYTAVSKSLTRVTDATKGASEADKKLQKQKDKLIEMINNKYNKAIDEAAKKLEALIQKLDDLKSATNSAINGAFDFGNALSLATQRADDYNSAIDEAKQVHDDYSMSVKDSIMSAFSMSDAFSKQQTAAQDLVKANQDLTNAQGVADAAQQKFNDAIDKYSGAAGRKARRDAYEEIQKAAADLVKPQEDLAAATLKANAAQAQQISFLEQLRVQANQAKSFASKISQLTGLGLSKEGIDQIIEAGAVTGSAMADELIKGGSVAIAETNELFKDIAAVSTKAGVQLAKGFFTIGNKVGVDFITALAAQANNATKFADKVKQLVAAGFSPGAIQQVLSAGVEAGTQIAQALLDGGSEAVATSTKIENALLETANSLNTLLGSTFYDAGISLAQQLVDGLEKKLAELKASMPDMNVPQLNNVLTGAPSGAGAGAGAGAANPYAGLVGTGKDLASKISAAKAAAASNLFGSFMGAVKALHPNYQMDKETPVADAKLAFPNLYAAMKAAGQTHAEGGLITSPQIGMIGEKGPEAIIPMDRLERMMGGGGQPINITVNAGMGADGATIGDAIVNELLRYQRRNGKIPVKTL